MYSDRFVEILNDTIQTNQNALQNVSSPLVFIETKAYIEAVSAVRNAYVELKEQEAKAAKEATKKEGK